MFRGFQVGILAEKLAARASCGNESDDRADHDAHAPEPLRLILSRP
jgi:hypothetical protein